MTDRISLAARADTLRPVYNAIGTIADGAAVVVSLEGAFGSGRSAVLEELAERLRLADIEVRRAEAFPADQTRPGAVGHDLGLGGSSSEVPVALLVDNAHWIDATSLGLLQLKLTTSVSGVLVVLALDRDVQRLELDALADAVGRHGTYIAVGLDHLTALDIEDLLGGRDEEVAAPAEILIDRSHGLADDLDRLVEAWLREGVLERDADGLVLTGTPPDVHRGRSVTLTGMTPQQRRVAEAALLARRPLSLEEISHLLGDDGDDALEVAESLARAGLLRDTPHGLAAASQAEAQRLAEDLGAMRRTGVYSDLADAAQAAAVADGSPGLVGDYLLRANRFREALPLLAGAGLDLAARQHFGEALPIVEQALDAYRQAEGHDPELEGRLLLARAEAYEFAGWPERAGEDLNTAVRRLTGRPRIRALGYAAAVADDRQRIQEAEQHLAAGLYETVVLGERAMQGSLLTLLARILQRLGFAPESDAVLAKGSALLDAHGDAAQQFRGRYNRAWIAFDRGQAAAAESFFDDCVEKAPELGGSGFVANVEAWLARARFAAGRPDLALEARRSAIVHADRDGSTAPIFLSHMALAEGAALYGSYGESLHAAEEMLGVVLRQLPRWENAARYLRAQALWCLGRLDEASDEAAAAIATTPAGVDGERWRHKIRVLQMRIDTDRGEPWPSAEALRLTDQLLGARRYASAIALMAARAAYERDPDLGVEAAALATQIGAPMAAAEAVHAAGRRKTDEGIAVASAVRRVERHLPEEWQEGWRELPWVQAALATEVVGDDEYQKAVGALERRIEVALQDAGLADVEALLSPAQRQARGLRRRRRRRPWRLVAAAALTVAAVVAVTFIALSGADRPENTRLDPIEVVSQWRYLDSSAGGPPRAGLGVAGDVAGYYWKFPTSDPIRSSPVLYGRLLIFGSDDGFVYAVDAQTGDAAWSFDAGGAVQSAIAIADVPMQGQGAGATETPARAFFATIDGRVFVRDPVLGNAPTQMLAKVGGVVTSPVVVGGTVYVASIDGSLYAFDVQAGSEIWRYETGAEIVSTPVLGAGFIWVGNRDGRIYALNPTDGSLHCSISSLGPIETTPLVLDDRIFVGTAFTSVFAYTLDDCKLASSIVTEAPVEMTPVVLEDVAYEGYTSGRGPLMFVAENRFMRAVTLDGSGDIVWQFITEGTIRSSPSVAEGVLYFGDGDGYLYALDVATGNELWRYRTDGPINSAPALAPGVVFAASLDGTVYAVGNGDTPEKRDMPVEKPPFTPATGTTTTPPSDEPAAG